MRLKRPVLLSVFWLPMLLLVGWLLVRVVCSGRSSHDGRITICVDRAVVPLPVEKPLPALLFPEKELVGDYYMGNGLWQNCVLTLTADHRFTFLWNGSVRFCDDKGNCHIMVHDANLGTWEMQGDVMVMHPEKPNIRDGMRGMAERLIPVKWGKRCFLVDENQMPAFCVASRDAAHREPNVEYDGIRSIYYIQMKNWKPMSVSGKSLLPERYQEYYRLGDVTGKVVRIDAQGQVHLKVSAVKRVHVGMLFAVATLSEADLRVLSVREDGVVCKVLYREDSMERVKAGDACTTGSEDYFPAGTGTKAYTSPPQAEKRTAQ